MTVEMSTDCYTVILSVLGNALLSNSSEFVLL